MWIFFNMNYLYILIIDSDNLNSRSLVKKVRYFIILLGVTNE